MNKLPKICPWLNSPCRESDCAVYAPEDNGCAVLVIARTVKLLAKAVEAR